MRIRGSETRKGRIENPPAAASMYSRRELVADGCVHVLGVVGSLIAMIALLVVMSERLDGPMATSLVIYGVGTIGVFVISGLYNMDLLPSRRRVMRRLDHAAIFLKIAGTYTPFATVALGGGWGVAVLGAVWSIAAIGVPLQLLAPDKLERVGVGLYLMQGWLVVLVIGPLSEALPASAFQLLMLGGGLYTAGVVFHVAERIPFHNAIWHAFVLAASACMYGAILISVAG